MPNDNYFLLSQRVYYSHPTANKISFLSEFYGPLYGREITIPVTSTSLINKNTPHSPTPYPSTEAPQLISIYYINQGITASSINKSTYSAHYTLSYPLLTDVNPNYKTYLNNIITIITPPPPPSPRQLASTLTKLLDFIIFNPSPPTKTNYPPICYHLLKLSPKSKTKMPCLAYCPLSSYCGKDFLINSPSTLKRFILSKLNLTTTTNNL